MDSLRKEQVGEVYKIESVRGLREVVHVTKETSLIRNVGTNVEQLISRGSYARSPHCRLIRTADGDFNNFHKDDPLEVRPFGKASRSVIDVSWERTTTLGISGLRLRVDTPSGQHTETESAVAYSYRYYGYLLKSSEAAEILALKAGPKTRTVTFEIEVEVEDEEATYIAMDQDGKIYSYHAKPRPDEKHFCFVRGSYQEVPVKNWKSTLTELK